jgi:methionyl-tRNA formyltransferase
MSLRAVFLGTPEFAVPSLASLVESGTSISLVVTQPDRPVGRHAAPRPSAVAAEAARRGLPAEKPERLRGNTDLVERIQGAAPDVGVVVAYGRILPAEILTLPRLGFVNVHASLLPAHRGASPIQAALLAGEKETGVVTMKVEEELDSGPLYLERRVAIEEREDAGALSRRLSGIGAELLVQTLEGLETGTLSARPQIGTPSYCRPIRREDGEIDWSAPAEEILRRLRALTPWPGLYTFAHGGRLKILEAEAGPATEREPGSFWREADRFLAAAGAGSSLLLRRVQRAGGRPVEGDEFANSLRETAGRFGWT